MTVKQSATSLMNLLYRKKIIVIIIWFIPILAFAIKGLFRGFGNNYQIFKYVYYNAVNQVSLYSYNPEFYDDCNHYGPVFSFIMAPFAILPDALGAILFTTLIAISLCYAINSLPIEWKHKVWIYLLTAHSMFTSSISTQTNPLIAALIIGAFVAINKEKYFWAACFIVFGFYLKLYGIVGLAFFFFAKDKLKFLMWLVIWAVIWFVIPMILFSPSFIVKSYSDWYVCLLEKNGANMTGLHQDISVMGMLRRMTGDRTISNLVVIVPAIILFGLQYLKFNMYKDIKYRLFILASVLLFVVLFSSGSESPTYIIAMVGVGIWLTLQKTPFSKYVIFLLIITIALTSFGTSDLFPLSTRIFIREYALQALPCFMVWLMLLVQVMKMKVDDSLTIQKE